MVKEVIVKREVHHINHNPAPADPLEVAVFAVILLFTGLYFAFKWLSVYLMSWHDFPMPYNLVAGFYYYTVILPINSFQYVWYSVRYNSMIPYPNASLVLAVLAVAAYAYIIWQLLKFAIRKLNQIGIKTRRVVGLFLLPLLLAGIWALGGYGIQWLLTT